MATTVIYNSCIAGVMSGMASGRSNLSALAADYADDAATAKLIADEFIIKNAASGAPIADADNAQIGPMVQAAANGVLSGRYPTGSSTPVAADFATLAGAIYGIAAAGKAKLT